MPEDTPPSSPIPQLLYGLIVAWVVVGSFIAIDRLDFAGWVLVIVGFFILVTIFTLTETEKVRQRQLFNKSLTYLYPVILALGVAVASWIATQAVTQIINHDNEPVVVHNQNGQPVSLSIENELLRRQIEDSRTTDDRLLQVLLVAFGSILSAGVIVLGGSYINAQRIGDQDRKALERLSKRARTQSKAQERMRKENAEFVVQIAVQGCWRKSRDERAMAPALEYLCKQVNSEVLQLCCQDTRHELLNTIHGVAKTGRDQVFFIEEPVFNALIILLDEIERLGNPSRAVKAQIREAKSDLEIHVATGDTDD